MSTSAFKNINREDLAMIQKVMVGMGWKYGYGDNAHIPTVEDLKKTLDFIVSDLESSTDTGAKFSSGGFFVYKGVNNEVVIDFDVDGTLTDELYPGLDDEE